MGLSWSFLIGVMYGAVNDELKTLLLLILIDLICGLILASVFKNSAKTDSGAISSKEMTKGIFKKVGILLLVSVAHRIDLTLHIDYIMYACEIALIIEEIISIVENIGLMGVPIPSVITSAIDLLNKKIDDVMKGE